MPKRILLSPGFPPKPSCPLLLAGKAERQILLLSQWLCDVCRDSCSTLCVQGSATAPPRPGLQLCWALCLGRKSHFTCCHLLKGKELQVFSPSAHPAGQTHGHSWLHSPEGLHPPCVTPGPP